MSEMTYREAIGEALAEEMSRDPDVCVLGEDIGAFGGAFQVTAGLQERFGPLRVLDTPITPSALIGAAVGAALMGLRPIVEMQYIDFVSCGFDQIVNMAAKLAWRTGGAMSAALVIRGPSGGGTRSGPWHSQSPEAWDYVVPLGQAATCRVGHQLTVLTYGAMVYHALTAADRLAAEHGVAAEVIDLRSLAPLDRAAIATSVHKTNRVLIVHEDTRTGGVGAELAAFIAEELFDELDAPVVRVAAPDTPFPYAPTLEAAYLPNSEMVVAAARKLLTY